MSSGESDDYDEFGMLGDNAAEVGLVLSGLPKVNRSSFTVAEDVAEFRRLLPAARVEVVPSSGHAIQSNQPLLLTQLIENFIFSRSRPALGGSPVEAASPGRRRAAAAGPAPN